MTLLEILLVVGIVIILAAVIFVYLDPVGRLRNARIARIESDAKQIEKAIEVFAADKRRYPRDDESRDTEHMIPNHGRMARINICSQGTPSNLWEYFCVNLDELVDAGYLPKIPLADLQQLRPEHSGFSVYRQGRTVAVEPTAVHLPRALRFAHADDGVAVIPARNSTALNITGPGAISVWVKAEPHPNRPLIPGLFSSSDYGSIVVKKPPNIRTISPTNYFLRYTRQSDVTCPGGASLCIQQVRMQGGFSHENAQGNTVLHYYTSTNQNPHPLTTSWHHLVVTWGDVLPSEWNSTEEGQEICSKGLIVYNNGAPMAYRCINNATPYPSIGDILYIGTSRGYNHHENPDLRRYVPNTFHGVIDDVRLYDRYLSHGDVQLLFDENIANDPTGGLIHHWTLNDYVSSDRVANDVDPAHDGRKGRLSVTVQNPGNEIQPIFPPHHFEYSTNAPLRGPQPTNVSLQNLEAISPPWRQILIDLAPHF